MSDQHGRPDSSKSRQELLDEIYYLRDIAGERGEQIQLLKRAETEEGARAIAELDRILHSRSWRLTAPLRWLARTLGRARPEDEAPAMPPPIPPAISAASSTFHGPERARAEGGASQAQAEARTDGERRLYVDISELVLRRGRTGVQRVTREILRALLASPPPGFVVQPVYAPPGQPYQSVRLSAGDVPGAAEDAGARIDPRAGDVFLGLDHSMRSVVERASDLDAMHRAGVRTWFVCNDVLPLQHPEWFPDGVPPRFEAWLRVVLAVADGIACISRATESALRERMDAFRVPRERTLEVVHFGLGADMASGTGAAQMSPEEAAQLERLEGLTTFLMVGTLEPRKGHAQALEAFDRLWSSGEDVALVLAGLPGWMTEVLQRRIRHHDEIGRRLFWFNGASDALLERLYSSCTVLLAPSQGEGFGLPLVEAVRHGLPILCRDLPVFREVTGNHATYFNAPDAVSLATAILEWLVKYRGGKVSPVRDMPWFTWSESARQLVDLMLADDSKCDNGPGSASLRREGQA